MRIVQVKCMAIDPVPCGVTFRGGSELLAARQLLAHLDAVHVHDGRGPSWSLDWCDGSGAQNIGQDYRGAA